VAGPLALGKLLERGDSARFQISERSVQNELGEKDLLGFRATWNEMSEELGQVAVGAWLLSGQLVVLKRSDVDTMT
jgi:hypothetical protein